MIADYWNAVRIHTPLIHNITNYVTVNDVANILLACGASPIMSDDVQEAEEITGICNALNINIGTLNQRTIPAMLTAGKRAVALGHPVVLDPVGVGASSLRLKTALQILQEVPVSAIRGNISELKALFSGIDRVVQDKDSNIANDTENSRGVDANISDAISEDILENGITFAKSAAKRFGAVVAITGAIDLVADAERCYVIRNGRAEMGRITGTGCQLSGLTAACLAANCPAINPANMTGSGNSGWALDAAATAVIAMGLAGEIAWLNMLPTDGNATYRNRIIDAIYHMDGKILAQGAKYVIR